MPGGLGDVTNKEAAEVLGGNGGSGADGGPCITRKEEISLEEEDDETHNQNETKVAHANEIQTCQRSCERRERDEQKKRQRKFETFLIWTITTKMR